MQLPNFVLSVKYFTMKLVNNQLDAQFFMYVYFYSLRVSGSHVPIIRRIIASMRHLVYVTPCRWPSGKQVNLLKAGCRLTCLKQVNLLTRRPSTRAHGQPNIKYFMMNLVQKPNNLKSESSRSENNILFHIAHPCSHLMKIKLHPCNVSKELLDQGGRFS